MDKRHFDQLVKGVREMTRHMAGKSVRGTSETEMSAPDVRTIRAQLGSVKASSRN